jgi:WD40 repeat protein
VKLWDIATGQELKTFKGHKQAVSFVAFSPYGRAVASGSTGDHTVNLWDASAVQELRIWLGPDRPAFSSDGRWMASGFNQGTFRIVWSVLTFVNNISYGRVWWPSIVTVETSRLHSKCP